MTEQEITPVNDSPETFQLTWLTSRPLLRGNWVAMGLGLIPAAMAVFSLVTTLGLDEASQQVSIFSGALFLSLSMTLIQLPVYAGRVELAEETLTIVNRFSGKRGRQQIPREALDEVYFAPLNKPPKWLPFVWAIVEVLCAVGAVSAGCGVDNGGEHWIWLTALVLGLSFGPLMAARWQAEMQVVLTYDRAGDSGPGLIRAWATPHQAGSLVNTLLGKINWSELERERDT